MFRLWEERNPKDLCFLRIRCNKTTFEQPATINVKKNFSPLEHFSRDVQNGSQEEH